MLASIDAHENLDRAGRDRSPGTRVPRYSPVRAELASVASRQDDIATAR
jgi:hypothetical protein